MVENKTVTKETNQTKINNAWQDSKTHKITLRHEDFRGNGQEHKMTEDRVRIKGLNDGASGNSWA